MKLKEIFNKYYERSHNPSDWHAIVDITTEFLHFLYNNPELICEAENNSYFDYDAHHDYIVNYIKIKENNRRYYIYFQYLKKRHALAFDISWYNCKKNQSMNLHLSENIAKYVRKKLSNEEKTYFVLTYDQLLEMLCKE